MEINELAHTSSKSGSKNIIFGIIFIVALIFIWFGYSFYLSSPVKADTSVVIVEGTGVDGIAQILQEEGIISSPLMFKTYVALTGQASDLKAGNHYVSAGSSVAFVVDSLVIGNNASNETTIQIIEGWKTQNVLAELQQQGFAVSEEELNDAFRAEVTTRDSVIYEGLPANAIVEGYLAPDTYNVFTDATTQEIVAKLLDHFEEQVTPEMEEQIRLKTGYTFYELLSLASIVEKEVSIYQDRQYVAGIFLQRLADSYPLQSDATVNYVTGKKTTQPTFKDTEIENPYNTYANAGLPPSPISNPSISAIQATLDPIYTDNYFFLTTPEGEAIFSTTFEEHLQNKKRYYP